MDLTFSDEQRMLAETARVFGERACPSSRVRGIEDSELGYDPTHWQSLADMGLVGLLAPDPFGGGGQGVLELTVVAEALGRAPLPSPFLTSAVVATEILLRGATTAQQDRWLPGLVTGTTIATLALIEPGALDEWSPVAAVLEPSANDFLLTGRKILVPFAAAADVLIVAARAPEGPALVVVDPRAAGVTCRRQYDGSGEAVYEVTFGDVRVAATDVLGTPGSARTVLDAVLDRASVVALGAVLGGAQRALELSLEHAGSRRQFGQPIGAFQAVAHRCVDMLTEIEAARFLCYQAAWCLDAAVPSALAVAAANAFGTEAVQHVFTHAQQVHGAIGFSMEHDLQLYARRGKAYELTWGSASKHQERVAVAMGLGRPRT